MKLTAGQEADVTHAGSLLADHQPEAVIADKGYDSDRVRAQVKGLKGKAVIPLLSCRKTPIKFDRAQYKHRNLAERYWSAVKQCRRVATRNDKLGRNFMGFVHVASIRMN